MTSLFTLQMFAGVCQGSGTARHADLVEQTNSLNVSRLKFRQIAEKNICCIYCSMTLTKQKCGLKLNLNL